MSFACISALSSSAWLSLKTEQQAAREHDLSYDTHKLVFCCGAGQHGYRFGNEMRCIFCPMQKPIFDLKMTLASGQTYTRLLQDNRSFLSSRISEFCHGRFGLAILHEWGLVAGRMVLVRGFIDSAVFLYIWPALNCTFMNCPFIFCKAKSD